ncbi:PhnD/SsuA/transferrin family substrate-binding protein [Candidatus Sumerlaeota bacterium]|nr:PhnD/SsuA/transferrin family substrate-binding protein [Candidatus Sumerlaeota bacterium]
MIGHRSTRLFLSVRRVACLVALCGLMALTLSAVAQEPPEPATPARTPSSVPDPDSKDAGAPALPVRSIPNRPVSHSLVTPDPLKSAIPLVEPLPPEKFDTWFRIGYLRPATESPLGEQWYRDLQTALEADPEFAAFIEKEVISGVALRPCDGPVDMLQRMLQSELDMVFCPAMVYAQERIQREHRSRYRVLFQTQRWRDLRDSHGGPYVRHRGVLFVRRGSDLDVDPEQLGKEAIKSLLADRILAVSGSYDAAGYFYVRKKLWDEYETAPKEVLFCRSPEEVVKAVVSGLAEVGGCEEHVLRDVFNTLPSGLYQRPDLDSRGNNDFVRVLIYTQWVPVDPVVVQDYYFETPGLGGRQPIGAEIGRAAANAVKRFYNEHDDPTQRAPRLELPRVDADLAYDLLVKDVELTRGYGW